MEKLLFCLSLNILVIAGVYYLVYHGCDLEKEHDDITCQDVFILTIFPLISVAKIHVIGMLASWGLFDFKSTLRDDCYPNPQWLLIPLSCSAAL